MLVRRLIILFIIVTTLTSPTHANVIGANMIGDGRYDWPVLGVVDGDTLRVHLPGLPMELQPIKVRVRGIDTPETRGKCAAEKLAANKATALTRFLVNDALTKNKSIIFAHVDWDKYGGRIDADVEIDGQSLGGILIRSGLARPYAGGKRMGWC